MVIGQDSVNDYGDGFLRTKVKKYVFQDRRRLPELKNSSVGIN